MDYRQAAFKSEMRATGKTISGKIPYNSLSLDLGGFCEKLSPRCFSPTLKTKERVLMLWSHDPAKPLASTEAGTLRLQDKPDGLYFTAELGETTWAKDALEAIRNKITTGVSFGFRVLPNGDTWEQTKTGRIRTVLAAELRELSPVSWPAYPSTSVRGKTGMITTDIKECLEQRKMVLDEMRYLTEAEHYDREKYEALENEFQKLTDRVEVLKREAEMKLPFEAAIKPDPQDKGPSHQERREDPWEGGKSMRIIRPGERRQAPKPSEVEARDLGRLLAVGQYALSDAEKARFEQRRTLQADKDVTGGFVILPESYSNQILIELNDAVFIRSLATQIELKFAASLAIPYEDNAGDDASWTAELATGQEDASISFEKRALHPHPSAKRVKLSRTLAQRSAGFQQWAISRLSYKFALTEEKAFLTGNGANRPMGLFTTPAAGGLGISSSRDVSTGNSATEIKGDNLHDVLMSLKAQYRKNAVWVFHRDAIKQIRKLKDGQGNYLLQVGLSADKPDTILGKRYYESEFAPNTFTTGQLVGLCGDLSFYWVVTALAMEIQVLNELYAEQNAIGLIGRMEVDGAPILESAFARVKLA
jgi:HK97 family phage major capsid protein/HK97 family phage prohead protease